MKKTFASLALAVLLGITVWSCSDDSGGTSPSPAFDIVSPDGNEVIQVGETVNIEFENEKADSVVFKLYKSDQFTQDIEVQYVKSEIVTWTLSTSIAAGNDYRIRMEDAADSTLFTYSAAYFTIVALGDYIVVTSPNGGENIEAGTLQTITWEDNISEWVGIEVYYDGVSIDGPNYTASDGSYDMYVPSDSPEGSLYKIKITSEINPGITDESNDYFSVVAGTPKYIRLISPNGGETYQAGTTLNILWDDNIDENVWIFIVDGENMVGGWETESDGSYSIDIPFDNEVIGDSYGVFIVSVYDDSIYDASDNTFSITQAPPSIRVEFPNGGENLVIGYLYEIEWDTNIGGNVKIEFYENDILMPGLTIDNAGNQGWYDFQVPGDLVPASNMKIKITGIGDPTVYDWSDDPFNFIVYGTIPPPSSYVTVSVPHTGDYSIGVENEVDWYRVYLDSGKEYFFENTSDVDLDTAFYLFGPTDGSDIEEVAYSDDGWDQNGLQPQIWYVAPASGYYYLRVAYWTNDVYKKETKKEKQYGYGTGPYALHISEITSK